MCDLLFSAEGKQHESSDLVHHAWHNASQWLKELTALVGWHGKAL